MRPTIKAAALATGIAALAACGVAKADTGVLDRLDINRQCLIFHATDLGGTDLGSFAVPLSAHAANTPPLVTPPDLIPAHEQQAAAFQFAFWFHRNISWHPVDPVDCGPYGLLSRAADPDAF